MDIGPEQETIYAEPLEDPFRRPEPHPEPEPAREPAEPVEVPA